MLSEKIQEKVTEMESYFKQIGEKYDILSLETVIYFYLSLLFLRKIMILLLHQVLF